MNTAIKTNVYPINRGDNGITKSRSKKDLLLDSLRKCIALRHYSKATERAYVGYVSEYIDFRAKRQSQEQGAKAIEEYLTHLAIDRKVAAEEKCSQKPIG